MVIRSISSEPVRTAPRASTSAPISRMPRNMSARFPAIVISSTGIGNLPAFDPEAGRAAGVVAGHDVDAHAHELRDQQPGAHLGKERIEGLRAGVDGEIVDPAGVARGRHRRACGPSSCRGRTPGARRRRR